MFSSVAHHASSGVYDRNNIGAADGLTPLLQPTARVGCIPKPVPGGPAVN
jgi:hypothetical protein